jgi:hypothetical protein
MWKTYFHGHSEHEKVQVAEIPDVTNMWPLDAIYWHNWQSSQSLKIWHISYVVVLVLPILCSMIYTHTFREQHSSTFTGYELPSYWQILTDPDISWQILVSELYPYLYYSCEK